jgi:tRNA nucleotidyltransferase (CCA-adding enzyme)
LKKPNRTIFDELSANEVMKDLIAVRVCRLIIEISLSDTDDLAFEQTQTMVSEVVAEPEEPASDGESETSDNENVNKNTNENALKPLQFRKGPPPETPPRASFDELDVQVASMMETSLPSSKSGAAVNPSSQAPPAMSDVDSLISELVESGDSLRLRAEKCAAGSSLQQRLLGEAERA